MGSLAVAVLGSLARRVGALSGMGPLARRMGALPVFQRLTFLGLGRARPLGFAGFVLLDLALLDRTGPRLLAFSFLGHRAGGQQQADKGGDR
jgi:hypothetical protein